MACRIIFEDVIENQNLNNTNLREELIIKEEVEDNCSQDHTQERENSDCTDTNSDTECSNKDSEQLESVVLGSQLTKIYEIPIEYEGNSQSDGNIGMGKPKGKRRNKINLEMLDRDINKDDDSQDDVVGDKTKKCRKYKLRKTEQGLVVRPVEEMPRAQSLETPLHAKRRRMWEPYLASTSHAAMDVETAPPSPQHAPAAYAVPWPATYLECGSNLPLASPSTSSSMRHPPPRRRPRQNVRDEEAHLLNVGSDADSDESDEGEEDAAVLPMVPRVLRAMMTPWVQEDDEEGGAAPAGVDAALAEDPGTDRPWSLFDFEWREFPSPPIPPESRRETFSQINVGPLIPNVDPYDIFVAIWDRQFMEYIASETNRYAQQWASQLWDDNVLHPRSRIARWGNDTTADELYVYFGIILAMGVVVKSRIHEYWGANSDIFYTPGFSAHMSINRFILLNKCLHFVNNDAMRTLNMESSEARLFKVRPLLSHLNEKFQSIYILSQNIALDESLLMRKGWLDISQLIPNKAATKGIKTYEICESRTGYLWRFEVHAHGKSDPRPLEPENPLERVVPSIVLKLVQGLEYKGYTLWMDNFSNSPVLARRLKSLGLDCVGTLRTDRQFLPEALRRLTRRRMRQGDISGLTSGDVDVMVWRDANRVATISTYHGNGVQEVRGSIKPILIHDYNIMMGGVDKKDQILAMYPTERKRSKVWYKKLFRRLLNVSVLNSLIIHRQNSSAATSSPLCHRQFRISLIKSLLSKHSPATIVPRPIPQNMTHDVTHRLALLPMGSKQRIRRTCVVCKKLVNMCCVGCDKSVCFDPCFLSLHTT